MYYSTNVKRSSKTTILGLIHSETTDLMRKKVITALITVRWKPENSVLLDLIGVYFCKH